MRIARVVFLVSVVVALASPASAASMQPGASLLAVQLVRGVADLASGPSATGITWFNSPEMGVQAQYWYFMREEYAVNLSAGIGYFRRSDAISPGLGGGFDRFIVNSWQVRLGGDRFGKVSDKLQVFAGPGVQVWGGRFKREDQFGDSEGPTAIRWALTGRIGAHIDMGQNFGLIGHLGQYWGYVSAEADGSTTKALPSGSEGAMGFSFGF